jgi:hypothetical protein
MAATPRGISTKISTLLSVVECHFFFCISTFGIPASPYLENYEVKYVDNYSKPIPIAKTKNRVKRFFEGLT